MKKYTPFLKIGSILSFLFLFTGIMYGQQDKLEPGNNPAIIVPAGNPVTFTAELQPAQSYTNAYLTIEAPAGWTITEVSNAGVIESDFQSARIAFGSLTGGSKVPISVKMRPDCSIVQDATITYRFYDSANTPIFTAYSNPISNIKYPAFAFSTPADTIIRGIIPAYREWQVMERDDDAYATGGHLTINVTSQPGSANSAGVIPYIRILGVEMYNPTSKSWEPLSAAISPDQLSYTYTFTEEDIKKIGNDNGEFGSAEVIRVREQVKFDYCSNITITTNPSLKYDLTHSCTQTAIETDRNGTCTISFRDPYYQSTTINSTRVSVPTGPSAPGKILVELKNTSELHMANLSYMLSTGINSSSPPGWIPDITAAYFSDQNGNLDSSAPANSLTITNNTTYGSASNVSLIEFTGTTPYKGLVAKDSDGICNDLEATAGGESIFLTIEYNVNLAANIPVTCDGIYDEYLFSNDFRGILNYYSPECNYAYTGSTYLSTLEMIGFTSVDAYMDNPNLVLGTSNDKTIMHVTDIAQGSTQSILLNNPGSTHRVKIELPADLQLVVDSGIKINGVAVANGDIEYDQTGGNNTIIFYNRNPANMNTPLIYNFTVKGIATGVSAHNLDISHIFNWGTESYEYSCHTTNVTYLIRVEGDCDYIVANSQRSERTSLGYKNRNKETFGSLDEARAAGVDLSVAGPYDNVEFEIEGTIVGPDVEEDVKAGKVLYAQIYYMNSQTNPYFGKGEGAQLQYKEPGESWSSIIEIPADDLIVASDSTPGSHRLQVNITPYLANAGISLATGTQLKVTILARATADLPNTKTAVNMLELGIYNPDRYQYGCNLQQDNFFVFDYELSTSSSSSHLPSSLVLYANGQEGYNTEAILRLSLNNATNYVATAEVFPNEYRPNEIINGFTWNAVSGNAAQTILVDRVYDSEGNIFYNGTDYTVSYTGSGTSITFRNNLNIYTGEYYRTRDGGSDTIGQQAYYVFADVKPICIQSQVTSVNYQITSLERIKYPTSANPAKTSGSANGVPVRSFSGWNISTASSQSTESTGSNIFSWPLTLTNASTWATGTATNTTIPYTYLAIELINGDLVDFELYEVINGAEVKVNAPFEYCTGRAGTLASGWIKIGEVTGTKSWAGGTSDFVLKARTPDCSTQSQSNIRVQFGANGTTYPVTPWSGFSQYGGSRCPITGQLNTSLTGTFLPMDFSGTVDDSRSLQPDNTYILCEPIVLKNIYSNNFSAPVTDLRIKIYRDSPTALTLTDPATTISYTQGGVTYLYDATWTIEQTDDYIWITLPETAELQGYGDAEGGDELTVTFGVVTGCDFIFGEPVYMDMYGSSLCGITQFDDISTRNIDLNGYDPDKNPVVQLTSFEMLQINNGNYNGGSGNYHIYPYLQESDGKFRLTGNIDYQTVDAGTDAYAYINLPDNMQLISGGVNKLTRSDNSVTSVFTLDGNVLQAPFTQVEPTSASYTFTIDVEAVHPQQWDCQAYDLNVGIIVTSAMQCSAASCEVKNAVLTENHEVLLQKYDVEILADSISFTEHYDFSLNQGRITVKASLVNNSSEDIDNLEIYLYRDANANGVYDENDTPVAGVTLPYITIPANSQVDITEEVEIADVEDICQLMLVMPKSSGTNMYLCDSAFVKKAVTYDLAVDYYRICQNDILLLGDPQIGNYAYNWTDMTGACDLLENNLAQSRMKIVPDSYLGGNSQTQRVKLVIDRDPLHPGSCLSEELYVDIYVEPARSEWLGTNTMWEDAENWSNGIPGKCTYVYVPGNTSYYPVLTNALTDPDAARCDTIEFAHGAEVAKTHLLDYSAAKVNLTLEPDRWTMLSAPLRYMHTGDYYVNGYDPNALTWGRTPDVYWMYFRMANPENVAYYNAEYYWSMPFNILEETMDAGKGLLVWPDLENNMTAATSGRIPPVDNLARFTFPRLEDEYYYYNGSGFSDPGYTGTEQEGDRAFYPGTSSIWLVDLDRKTATDSDSLRSRFTYEGLPTYNLSTGSFVIDAFVNDPSAETALVGNPFMSHLNLQAFQQANAGIIRNDFYIWSNTNSGGFFEAVKMLNSDMDHISTSDFLPVVPPMQSFIVVKQPGTSTFNTFTITPDMAVTSPGSKIRSMNGPGALNIGLYNIEERESAITVVYEDGLYDASYEQYTLFPSQGGAKILYALSENSGSKRAVSIRSAGSPEDVIPLAIKTNNTGDLLKFRLNDAQNFDPYYAVYLEDREKGILHDLRESDYIFTNYTGNIEEGRFYLRFAESETSIEDIRNSNEFYIYASNCECHILSKNDPVHEVSVFNLQGQQIHLAQNIHTEVYDFPVSNCENQVLIVRVKTGKDIRTRKIMMNR